MSAANPAVARVETVERMTHEDFMDLAPDDRKAELIEGVMRMPSPALEAHERLFGFLVTILDVFVSHRRLGRLLGSRYAVHISETETYEPDILFVRSDRLHLITQRKLAGAPDLVVEILSAGTAGYDRGVKRLNYEEGGVQELWLIDPYGPAGTQFYQRREGRLIEVAPRDGILEAVAIPGLRLRVSWLWPDEADEFPDRVEVLQELGIV